MCSLVTTTTSGGGLLSLHSSWFVSSVDRGSGHLDVLLRGDSDNEGWDVNHLLSNGDVSLSDENTGVMHGGSELSLDDEGLESSLHELGDSQSQDVIKSTFGILEESNSHHSSDECLTLNKTEL